MLKKLRMLSNSPSFSRFSAKLMYELLPAAIASAVGGMIFNHFAQAPAATPVASVATPANVDLIQMVRDEHTLFVDYLKKNAETRQQAELAAEQDAKRIAIAEQAAAMAVREARAAEARAQAAAARTAEKPEKRLAGIQPAHPAEKIAVIALPPSRQPVVASVQALPQPSPAPPAVVTVPAPAHDEGFVMSTLHEITATVEQIPSRIRSAADWFSEASESRPQASSAPRNFAGASM